MLCCLVPLAAADAAAAAAAATAAVRWHCPWPGGTAYDHSAASAPCKLRVAG